MFTKLKQILGFPLADLNAKITDANVPPDSRTITTSEGVQGGGDLSANRALKLDIDGLTADATPDVAADYVATWDDSTSLHKKVLLSNLPGAVSADMGAVAARRTTNFAVPQTPTFTDITFDTTDVENDTSVVEHDNTNTERVIVKETGLYYVGYSLTMDSPPTADTIDIQVEVNGTTAIPQSMIMSEDDSEDRSIYHAFIEELTANDYVTLQVSRQGGTAFNLIGDTILSVVRMAGPTGATGPAGSGTTITLEDEGTPVTNTPHDTLNFVGAGVTVADAGSGEATVTISAGAGDVTAAANLTDNKLVRGDGGAKGVQTSAWDLADNEKMSVAAALQDYLLDIMNTQAGSGGAVGRGVRICGGENLGEIVVHICDADDSFKILEIEADQGYITFGKTYAQTLTDNGVVYGLDQQGTGVSKDYNTQVGNYRIGGKIQFFRPYVFSADTLRSPNSSDWTVNALAPVAADSNNAGFIVRRFDDTTEEGVGFMLPVPGDATEMLIRFKSRAESPAATNVVPKLYHRQIPDNAAIDTWNSGTVMTALAMVVTNAYFQYDEQTITLATLGVTAGELVQFELTRDAANGSDTLVGDWNLLELEVEFH